MNAAIHELIREAEGSLAAVFQAFEETEIINTEKVLNAFREAEVSYRHFAPTNGYGYDDIGRDTLCRIYSRVMGTEAAFVRPQIASGTHAIALAIQSILRPGDTIFCVSGKPYDTLEQVIGISSDACSGSLKEYGINCKVFELLPNGVIDTDIVLKALDPTVKLIHIQRSRGYEWRPALNIRMINAFSARIHKIRPDICVFLDNCYGEFTHSEEPDVDLMAGSLIKNPGGGIAPTGGYIAGKGIYVDRASYRFTAPGIGAEVGSYAASYRPYYQGLFMAPHTVTQALKTAALTAKVLSDMGYDVSPYAQDDRNDIIQAVRFGSEKELISFIRSIQKYSPIDSNAVPEPWEMPGYQDKIIMAAGTFVAGASVELSADAPIRPPYTVYMQGSLTYTHGKIALAHALEDIMG